MYLPETLIDFFPAVIIYWLLSFQGLYRAGSSQHRYPLIILGRVCYLDIDHIHRIFGFRGCEVPLWSFCGGSIRLYFVIRPTCPLDNHRMRNMWGVWKLIFATSYCLVSSLLSNFYSSCSRCKHVKSQNLLQPARFITRGKSFKSLLHPNPTI